MVPEVGLFLVSLRPEPEALGVLRSVRMASCGPPSTTGPGLVSAFYEAIETHSVLSQHLHEDNFQALFTLCTPTRPSLVASLFLTILVALCFEQDGFSTFVS